MIKFTKMHGLGNDFMVIDAISQQVALTSCQISNLADRHFGVGFDQMLLVERPDSADADFKYRIFNADGGEVGQCGNGARCFARFVRDKKLSANASIRVETKTGPLVLSFEPDGQITVNMGVPRHEPASIPIQADREAPAYSLTIDGRDYVFGAVSLGNPHAVLMVDDSAAAPVSSLGPLLERHRFFPDRANIGFMQILDRGRIRLRVFERGAGETLACGSGACAAAVVGIDRGLLDRSVAAELPGGTLKITWAGRGAPVMMTGPAVSVFEGQIAP